MDPSWGSACPVSALPGTFLLIATLTMTLLFGMQYSLKVVVVVLVLLMNALLAPYRCLSPSVLVVLLRFVYIFLPRPVADAVKTALLAKAAPAGELLDADSDVMAWRRIQRLHFEADDPTSAEDIKELYHRYVTACQSVLDKAEATLREVQELEIPNLRHPLCLLKQWSSLPQAIERGDSMVRTIERERRIHSRLSSHPSGISLTWSTRRLLYGALLRATPLFNDSDIGFAAFIDRLEHSTEGDTDKFVANLALLAKHGGFSTIDKFLKLGSQRSNNGGNRRHQQGAKRPRFDSKNEPGNESNTNRSWYSPQPQGTMSTRDLASSSTRPKPSDNSRRSGPPHKRQSLPSSKPPPTSSKPITCYRCGQITHSLLTSHLRVLSEKPEGVDEVVSVALDTMNSVNLVTVSLAQRLGCSISSDLTRLTSLGNQSSPGKATDIRLFIVGKGIVSLHCLVVADDALEQSCDCEVLVGFRDLDRIGAHVTIPRSVEAPASTDVSWSVLESSATDYLRSRVNVWVPLVGAPNFSARLRPISPSDQSDTSEQKWVFEVHDFSPGLLAKLSAEAQKEYWGEIQKFRDNGWWLDSLPSNAERPVRESPIDAFADLVDGLVVLNFYDDLLLMVLCGSRFPANKCDDLRAISAPCRHLGLLWKIDDDRLSDDLRVSRRQAFSYAGRSFDPLRCHSLAVLAGLPGTRGGILIISKPKPFALLFLLSPTMALAMVSVSIQPGVMKLFGLNWRILLEFCLRYVLEAFNFVNIQRVVLYSDNSSAVHWATQLVVGTKSYDRIVIERLIDLFDSLISHIRGSALQSLQDRDYCKSVLLFRGINLLSILEALGVHPGDRASFQWDEEYKLLLYRDIKLHPAWYIYACTPRSQYWILYRFHYSPLLGCHRSAARCVDAALSEGWYFIRMPRLLKKWIRSCKICQLSKVGGPNPVQPSLFRRGAGRFSEVQFDFLGPASPSPDDDEPNGCSYLAVLVDSGTQMCMACPAKSTSVSSVISAVLQWCALFGPPTALQLDSPPAHSSDKLFRFLTVMGVKRSLGIPRRPECQGRVENVIKEIKLAISTNSVASPGDLPWLENNHRVLRGPFVISALHESNPFLYRLDGWSQGWVSLGQLLPYYSDEELRDFNRAVRPHQAYSVSTFRLGLPADVGIPIAEISTGDFVIYPCDADVDSSSSSEPRRTLYIMEVMDREGDTLQALSLNKDSKGCYKRPLVRERPDFTWTIDVNSVVGAFKPTKTRRLPSK
ncbi:hypothetical protein FOZ63_012201, partial [Perkinsus olseni]